MENELVNKYLIDEDSNKNFMDWIIRKATFEKDPKKQIIMTSCFDFLNAVKASSNEKWIRQAQSVVGQFVRSL